MIVLVIVLVGATGFAAYFTGRRSSSKSKSGGTATQRRLDEYDFYPFVENKVVFDNIKNKDGLGATLLGERTLKNVAGPVTLYSLDA